MKNRLRRVLSRWAASDEHFSTYDYTDTKTFVASVNDRTEHVWLLNPKQAEVRRSRRGGETFTLFRFRPTLSQEAKINSGQGTIVIRHEQIIRPD